MVEVCLVELRCLENAVGVVVEFLRLPAKGNLAWARVLSEMWLFLWFVPFCLRAGHKHRPADREDSETQES